MCSEKENVAIIITFIHPESTEQYMRSSRYLPRTLQSHQIAPYLRVPCPTVVVERTCDHHSMYTTSNQCAYTIIISKRCSSVEVLIIRQYFFIFVESCGDRVPYIIFCFQNV